MQKKLFEMQDPEYKKFHSALMPTVPPEKIIGVRIPELRKFAKEYFNKPESRDFINNLPHLYYEENNLHAFLIEQVRDYDEALRLTEEFLPYIDNWATCDMFMPRVFKSNKDKIIKKACEWIKSRHTYTIRYGIKILMSLYLDENFSHEQMELVSNVKSDEYYVKMMIAWYFATALAKQYDHAIEYLQPQKMDVWVHNKIIRKAIESKRLSPETKAHLRTLTIKREISK